MHKQKRHGSPARRWATLFAVSVQLICVACFQSAQAEEVPTAVEAKSFAPGRAENLQGISATAPNFDLQSVQAPVQLAQSQPTVAADEEDEPLDLLGEFNVTAQRRRTTERENTQTTYVVSKEDIKALGATNVSDALRLVPGFTLIQSLGGVDLRGQNSLRGLDDARFVILQDGRPLTRSSNNRASDISKLSTINVERIEVVSGGSTLRYGADAVGGVINVITITPEGPPKLNVGLEFGSFGFSQYQLNYSGSNGIAPTEPGYVGYDVGYERRTVINDFPFTRNITAYNGDDILFADGDGNFVSKGTSFSFSEIAQQNYTFSDLYYGKLIFKPGADHTITVYAQQQNTRRGAAGFCTGCGLTGYFDDDIDPNTGLAGPRGYSAVVYSKAYYNEYYNYDFSTEDSNEDQTGFNLTWDWDLSELNTLSTQFSYNHTWDLNPTGGGQKYLANRTLEAQVRYNAQLYPGNIFNAGFQFLSNRSVQSPELGAEGGEIFTLPNGGTAVPFDREISRWAVYFTEDLRFFDDALILNFGSRLTDDVQFGTFTTSGVGLRYNFGGEKGKETFGLRANWSQSFKAPGLSQLYATFTSGRNISLPNPDLQPEVGVGYDIGLDVALSPTAVFRATHFRIDLSNAVLEGVRVDENDTNTFTQTINAQATLSTGWELLFNWQLDSNWEIQLNHSIIDTRAIGDAASDGLQRYVARGYFYGIQTDEIPFNTTNLALTYNSPGFRSTFSGTVVGERRIANTSFYTDGYSRFDLTLAVPINSAFTLTAGVFNIFNEQYAAIASFGYPAVGTNFKVGLEATF